MTQLTKEQESVKKFDMSLWDWFKCLFSGGPHFTIWTELPSGEPVPQLLRWWILPRNRFLNIYLHKTIRDDEDRALHDHPWNSVSFLLKGRLGEVRYRHQALLSKHDFDPEILKAYDETREYEITRFKPKFRTADYSHRLFLPDGQPAWTLFITGPKRRKWGFHCPKGWIRWEKFVQLDNPGMPKGCGEYE